MKRPTKKTFSLPGILFVFIGAAGLLGAEGAEKNMTREKAVIAGGCFWCMEAVFQRLIGVERVTSGYSGGDAEDADYDTVKTGTTAHAEAVEIEFDPSKISYEEILEVFFHLHDPTTLNRQGADAGPQYRSAIFYQGEKQQRTAEAVKARIEAEKLWDRPIVTEITPLEKFYPAEDYHQNYYNRNPRQGYCSIVIGPKIQKLLHEFKSKLKPEVASDAVNG